MESLRPKSLTEIVRFVHSHKETSTITLMIRNSKNSARYFFEQCDCLIDEANPISDLQLAGLLVILAEVGDDMQSGLMSRASAGAGQYRWSQSMAASYLLQEVTSEKIRKSA